MTYLANLSYSSLKVLIVAVWYLVNMIDTSLKLRIHQPIRSQLLKHDIHSSLSRGIALRASYMVASPWKMRPAPSRPNRAKEGSAYTC